MKWNENGINFEGTPEEFMAIHADPENHGELHPEQPRRFRAGRNVLLAADGIDGTKLFKSLMEVCDFLRREFNMILDPSSISHELNKSGEYRDIYGVKIVPVPNASPIVAEATGKTLSEVPA